MRLGWKRYSAEVSEQDFSAVWKVLAELLEVPEDGLEPGVTESLLDDGFAVTALDAAQSFLAARWLAAGRCQELFCVKPASKPLQLGYSVLLPDGDATTGIPAALLRWLDATLHQVERLPSITALTTVLATQGASVKDVTQRESQFKAERDYLKQLLDEQRDLLRQVNAKLRMAPSAAAVANGTAPTPAGEVSPTSLAWSLEALAEWCAEHEEEVVVLPRARNGAKKSRYEEPAVMLQALEFLAGPYRDYRLGLIGREDFDAALTATGLRLAGSVAPSVAGEQGDAYFVSWAGRRRFLELHLAKGGGHDQRYCFRLYFFWDADSERAVVGGMPFHLANSLT